MTAKEVAEWMATELKKRKSLYQDEAADKIYKMFGKDFVYDNANGNRAISKSVLKEFNKMTGEEVVWCRSDRFWRAREKGDDPGRMQP